MKILFFGTPQWALPALRRVAGVHRLVGVVTAPDAPVKRSRVPVPPPVKSAALEMGWGPILQPPTLRGPETRAALARCGAEVLVVVAYGRILPGRVLDAAPRGAVNLHFSLLPRHRGAAPVQYTLWKGDREAGVSTMLMDRGLDTGPVLMQRAEPVRPADTVRELGARLADIGADLLFETLAGLEAGTLVPRLQSAEGVSWAEALRREHGLVRFSWTALEIERRLRGFGDWPPLVCAGAKASLRLVEAEALPDPGPKEAAPGLVWRRAGEAVDLVCAGGSVLRMVRVQPAGGREISAAAALSGRHLALGETLGEVPA